MANGFKLFLTALLSVGAFLLAVFACAGSTTNSPPAKEIYVAHLDLSNIKVSSIIPNITSASNNVGLPRYINLGLWSYCVSGTNSDEIASCTSPRGIQQFNLQSLIYDNIDDNETLHLLDSLADIVLPEKLKDKKNYYNGLVKCMFITLLIGIVVIFLNFVLNIVRWLFHFKFLTIIGKVLSCVAFLAFLISGGTSVGTYVYIMHQLSKNYDEYGIKLSLGRIFFCLEWAAIGASLLNFLLWLAVREKPRVVNNYIQQKGPYERVIL